jgi:hypothetical protein
MNAIGEFDVEFSKVNKIDEEISAYLNKLQSLSISVRTPLN